MENRRVKILSREMRGEYGVIIGAEKSTYTIGGRVLQGIEEETHYYVGGFIKNPMLLIAKRHEQLEFLDE